MAFLNRCVFTPTAGGVADFTLSAALPGYMSPVQAGAVNGTTYHYVAESPDKQTWEIGLGTWNSGILARTTVLWSSTGGPKVSFQGIPTVAIDAIAEDFSVAPGSQFATPAAFATFFQSTLGVSPPLNQFDTGVASYVPITNLFSGLMRVIAARSGLTGGNAIIGAAIQDMPGTVLANQSFPCGLAGYGSLTTAGAGNAVFGVFGRVDIAANGVAVNELDCNNTFADSPATYPPNLSFTHGGSPNGGTFDNAYALGLQIVNIGAHKAHSALRFAATGGAPFRTGLYTDPNSISEFGIFIDATATQGPGTSALLRGTGASSIILSQVMGTLTPAGSVWQVQDSLGNISFQLSQSGAITAGNSVSNPGAFTDFILSNVNAATGSGAAFFAQSNAGSFRMQASSTVDGAVGTLRWAGAGALLIDALNAAGVIQLRTDATPHTGAVIDSKQNVAMGDLAGNNSALATSATDGFIYIRTCAGAPTGVPTSFSGRDPLVYDTTNNKLWAYNGAWKGVVLS